MNQPAVATPHRLSFDAATLLLKGGGNACDAAIAAVVTQGVVAPETCGLGGDLFALIHKRGWTQPRLLNASGPAGTNVAPQVLRDLGERSPRRDHPYAVTVPGCVGGLEELSAKFGALDLQQCLAPARHYASEGFEVSAEMAEIFAAEAEIYRGNPAADEIYRDGSPPRAGEMVRRPRLSHVIEEIGGQGSRYFYEGPPGTDIVEATEGTISRADLASYRPQWLDPVGTEIFGHTCWTAGPNSQGYLTPAALRVFELLEPKGDSSNVDWWHGLIEAYRSVAWERDDLVAEPDSAPLPDDILLSQDRLSRAASSIDIHRAGVWPSPPIEEGGTAYLAISDGMGMSVSIIQSNYSGPGSARGARTAKFLLHDRGRGFTSIAGHPNEIRPGKRPLHTLSPTLWTHVGEASMLLGTRGGSLQPQILTQVGASVMRGGLSLSEAQTQPRWAVDAFGPHSASIIRLEPGLDPFIISQLERRGHRVTEMRTSQSGWGPVSIIRSDSDGKVHTTPDPRVSTTTAAVVL